MEAQRTIDLTPTPDQTLRVYARLLDGALDYAMMSHRTAEQQANMIHLIKTVRDELSDNANRLEGRNAK